MSCDYVNDLLVLPLPSQHEQTIVCLRLGLFEQDLAHRFGVSQSTVSRITCTWINFLYLKLKELPLWPLKELVKSNMPKPLKSNYPSTRIILDATEIISYNLTYLSFNR